jgi:hypothetical protein
MSYHCEPVVGPHFRLLQNDQGVSREALRFLQPFVTAERYAELTLPPRSNPLRPAYLLFSNFSKARSTVAM